jgi:glycosyltransferase involved in cell wall biosynthesis
VRALREVGVDAVLVPVYLPVETDEPPPRQSKIFFGGVSVFLEQYFPVFRRSPEWLDRLWDNRWILGLVGRLARSTRPEKLGPVTLSMLAGEVGYQRKELEKLVRFFTEELRPNLVHLSTGLLVGIARAIREELNIPVVANLAGEDTFLERLPDRYRGEARKLAATRLAELDALVALSRYYAFRASSYFQLPAEKVWIIPPGVTVPGGEPDSDLQGHPTDQRREICFGYLGRICPEKGFPLLVAAACEWAQDIGKPPVKWIVAGRVESTFRKRFDQLLTQARRRGVEIEYLGPLDREAKVRFFATIQVLILPSPVPEPKAITAIEAVARGVPVIAPAQGAFVEIIKQSGCGELYWPNEPVQLCKTLAQWITTGHRSREVEVDRAEHTSTSEKGDDQPQDEARGSPALDDTSGALRDSARWDCPLCLGEIQWEVPQLSEDPLPGDRSLRLQMSDRDSLSGLPLRGPSYYRAERMAKQTLALYRLLLSGRDGASPRPA